MIRQLLYRIPVLRRLRAVEQLVVDLYEADQPRSWTRPGPTSASGGAQKNQSNQARQEREVHDGR